MKLLLDTSYLLPFVGIRVKGTAEDDVRKAFEEHQVLISDVQIFELYAKGLKYLLQGRIDAAGLVDGVDAVAHGLEAKALSDPQVMRVTIKARQVLDDLLDAIVLSTALMYTDGLATLDKRIEDAYRADFIKTLNPELRIGQLGSFLGE